MHDMAITMIDTIAQEGPCRFMVWVVGVGGYCIYIGVHARYVGGFVPAYALPI